MGLKLVFVRHGHYIHGTREHDEQLSPGGRRAVSEIARKLHIDHDIHPDTIRTGIMPRVVESAGIVADEFKDEGRIVEPVRMHALDERNSFGNFAQGDLKHLPADCRTVVCVTHDAVITGNMWFLMDMGDNRTGYTPEQRINYAEALIVDFEAETWEEAEAKKAATIELVH